MINSQCHSDDHHVEIEFDATKWFEQASDDAIINLAKCDWGGDYPSDEVAIFFSDNLTSKLFEYVQTHPKGQSNDAIGFENYVNEEDAMAWLVDNKPEVAKVIEGHKLSAPGFSN